MKKSSIGMTMMIKKPALEDRMSMTVPRKGILSTYLPTMSPSEMTCWSAISLLSPFVVKLCMPLSSSIATMRCVFRAYWLSTMVWKVTMSPTCKSAVSHCWMTMRSPWLNVGDMESDCTVMGVKPARFETLPSSFVASVVNA